MVNTLTFSMAIDIQREEVLLPNDRRSITTKTNVNRTNKPSTNAGHLQKTPKRTRFGHLRAAPVRARFRLQVPRQSRRIQASKQASRSGEPARVAPMELRYETLTIPAPQRTHAGVDPVKLSVVHAREISPPPQGKRLEWFLLTTLPVTDTEQARRRLNLVWPALAGRRLSSGCSRPDAGCNSSSTTPQNVCNGPSPFTPSSPGGSC